MTIEWMVCLKSHKQSTSYFLSAKMEVWFLSLGISIFEFLITCKRIPNQIRIQVFSIFVLALVHGMSYSLLLHIISIIIIIMVNA